MTEEPVLRYRCADCGWTTQQLLPPRWCSSCGHDRFTASPPAPPPSPPDQEAA